MNSDSPDPSTEYHPVAKARAVPDAVVRAARLIVAQGNYPHQRIASIVPGHISLRDAWLDRRVLVVDPDLMAAPPEDSEAIGIPLERIVPDDISGTSNVVALVSPSGYGKSSAIQMLASREAHQLIEQRTGRVPAWLNATQIIESDVRSESTTLVLDLLRASPWTANCAEEVHEAINTPKSGIGAVFLIDAVDQLDFDSMGDALERLTQIVINLETLAPDSPILLTSRDDVWYSDRCRSLRRRATSFQLQSLDLADIVSYVRLYSAASPMISKELPHRLEARISAEPQLSGLMRRPLMLALGMHIVDRTGQMPDGLGGICSEIAQICLADPVMNDGFDKNGVETVLEEVSWQMEKATTRSLLESVSALELGECVRRNVIGDDRRSVQEASTKEKAFLGVAHKGIGIFGELAPNEFGFADDVFRLYYMGRYLARLDRDTLFESLAEETSGGALVLWAQALAYSGQVDSPMMLIEDLCESAQTSNTLLAGELLAAIIETAREARSRWLARWVDVIQQRLCAVRSGSFSLPERDRAGRALAVIGDPLLAGLPALAPTVAVEGGLCEFGSPESPDMIGDKPKYERIHWYPPYKNHLSDYEIAVHPVTNFEYAQFIDADGYQQAQLWRSVEARRWRDQDDTVLDWLTPVILKSLGLHYRKDIEAGFMSVVDFEKMRDEFIRRLLIRTTPLYWNDPRFNRANQPVVGINLWEAKAYCAWLTGLLRKSGRIDDQHVCRLPTEEEWEHAAGPAQQQYPWGPEWNSAYCHMRSTPWITSAVSIGTFATVPSHLGCQDMIGNVFDTTLSSADEYANRPSQHMDTAMREIITRGGSWLATAEAARSIRFRSWDPPCNAYADQSFRWVISEVDHP